MTQEELNKVVDSITNLDDAKALIRVLLERISKLEEEVAKLKKDSSTSSKPPSSDIVKPAHQQRQSGKRRCGGQPGHEGVKHALLPADKVDRVEPDLELVRCPDCGGELEQERCDKVLIQQIAELVEKPVEIIEYRRYGHLCPCCQVVQYPELPAGVVEGHFLGLKLQAMIAYMKGALGTSYRDICEFIQDVLGTKVSRATVYNVVMRTSEALKQPYEELAKQVPEEKVLNIDETGWKDNGKKFWVWLFCTQVIAFFTIKCSRACQVLIDVLGEKFDGAIISDFYSAYVCYANKNQQFCLAHLIREIKFLTTLPDPATKAFGEKMLTYFRILFRHWHARDNMPSDILLKRIGRLERKIFTFLSSNNIPTGDATRLQKRFVKHWHSLFRFVRSPDIYQPTNNLAEQTLRLLVRIRKLTQGTRSEAGRVWVARSITTVETCRKQKRRAWKFMLDSLHAYHFDGLYPSLIPASIERYGG